jgi:DNA-binding LacI/PurR family transcriptional regulator
VLIERHPDLTAIFASNDHMALGVLYAAEQLGLVVPDDLAVVGYDDIPEAVFFHPALSSIQQDVVNLGASAVARIIRAIDSLAIRGTYPSETIVIEPKLVVRASSKRS